MGKSLNNSADSFYLTFNVSVTNTGKTAGDEVAQAYFVPKNTSVSTPLLQQLFDFQRVTLQPGETVFVILTANRKSFLLGDTDGNLISSTGEYDIVITNGVDEVLQTTIYITGDTVILDPFPSNIA